MLRSCSISGRDLKFLFNSSGTGSKTALLLCYISIRSFTDPTYNRSTRARNLASYAGYVYLQQFHLQSPPSLYPKQSITAPVKFSRVFFFSPLPQRRKKTEEISVKVLRLNSLRPSRIAFLTAQTYYGHSRLYCIGMLPPGWWFMHSENGFTFSICENNSGNVNKYKHKVE